jgi:hypothetical protein
VQIIQEISSYGLLGEYSSQPSQEMTLNWPPIIKEEMKSYKKMGVKVSYKEKEQASVLFLVLFNTNFISSSVPCPSHTTCFLVYCLAYFFYCLI